MFLIEMQKVTVADFMAWIGYHSGKAQKEYNPLKLKIAAQMASEFVERCISGEERESE